MYRLYHHPICPFSRKVRTHLAAKEIGFELIQENFWERRKEFIAMNPAGTLPLLFDNSNAAVIVGSEVIIEYIEEKHGETKSFLANRCPSALKCVVYKIGLMKNFIMKSVNMF